MTPTNSPTPSPTPTPKQDYVEVENTVKIAEEDEAIYSPENEDGIYDYAKMHVYSDKTWTLTLQNDRTGQTVSGNISGSGNATVFWNGRVGPNNLMSGSTMFSHDLDTEFVPDGVYSVKINNVVAKDSHNKPAKIKIDNSGPQVIVNYNDSTVSNGVAGLNVNINDPEVNGVRSGLDKETIPYRITSVDGTQITLNFTENPDTGETSGTLLAYVPEGFHVASLSEDDRDLLIEKIADSV